MIAGRAKLKVFLTGFMGAGKSAVGARLAESVGLDFVDLDEVLEAAAGMPVSGIFETFGEDAFRKLERDALSRLCADERSLVVATGGGTPASERNRELMRAAGVSVWLDTRLEAMMGRLVGPELGKRPLLESAAEAAALWRERLPAYGTADLQVRPRDGETPEEIAGRIRESLEQHLAEQRDRRIGHGERR